MSAFLPSAPAHRRNSRSRRASRVVGQLPEALERRALLSGAVSFSPPVASAVGHDPGLSVADFNSDGRPDLAVADATGSTIRVMLGDGSGRFANFVVFDAGDRPNYITPADFNRDGRLDLVFTHWFGNEIGIMLGDGRGGFGAIRRFDAGGEMPRSPVAADFNGDGKLDLATAGWWAGGVRVHLGDGAGGFGAARFIEAGENTQHLLGGDFNDDGRQDLAVSNWGSGTVSVFLGDGAGNFSRSDFDAGGLPITMGLGDFNRDGRTDLAVGHGVLGLREEDVSILTGTAAGGFSAPVPLGGPLLKGFAVADFDGDGNSDLAVRTPDDADIVFVRLGDGAGGLSAPVEVAAGESDLVCTADFDGDGRADLGTFEPGGETLAVLINTTNRVYEAEQAAVTGATISADNHGFTGSGYADYANAAGDSVEFAVQTPSAGRYELAFRYANGGTSDRSTALWVNGAAVPGGVNFARTGSWRTWRDVTVAVPLASGANKVRVLATGQSGPNLDSLALRPVTPPASVTYQAESAVLSGALALSNVPGFTGSGFADYQHARGDFVEFPIDVPEDGAYALGFRYGNGSSSDRPLELRVDGAVLTGRLSFAPTGAWSTWKTSGQPTVLTAGRHVVRLTSIGSNGPNLDALTVAVATTPPVEPVTLQAEAAALSGPIATANHGGFTGTGFADYQNASGDSVEFTYDAPAVGDYLLEFRYANGSASDRPLDLRVNGAVARRGVSFAPTGSWNTWSVASATVALGAGANRIRLTAAGKSGPNLDALTVRVPTALLWPVSRGGNGHYYERVEVAGGITWEGARAAAQARVIGGVAGHLLAVNSPAELEFIRSSFPQALGSQHWLGGYQNRAASDYSEPSGGWRWVTGEPFTFAPWSTPAFGGNDVEPNNASGHDDFLATELSTHEGGVVVRFNDAPADYDVSGYYVEYPVGSGPAGAFITPVPGFAITWNGNEGESRGVVPVNLARADQGAVAFADHNRGLGDTDEFPGLLIHHLDDLDDGRYGNVDSWISDVEEPHFAGIRFNGVRNISAVAWGRDNGASAPFFEDRWAGRYTLQFTNVANPNAETPAAAWTTIGTIEYGDTGGPSAPWLRHRYEVARNGLPIAATGIRLLLNRGGHGNGVDIDEIEVFGA